MSKILMLTSEATPFASTGGLAEVLQGLPIALSRAGHQVAVLLPFYPQVRAFFPKNTGRTLAFTLGARKFQADLYEFGVHDVSYFFLDVPALYDRANLYGDGGADYADNHLRFGVLARGALAACETVFTPQIIHCHDWPAALLPVLLRESLGAHPTLGGIKTVFTIHNLAFQGRFPKAAAVDLGLNGNYKTSSALYPDGSVGFLKGALTSSDALTTVSPTYAREIQTPAYGGGLERLLKARRADLHGIVNGIDAEVWNPCSDTYLPAHFSSADLSGKRACKVALLKQFGLPPELAAKPLIGVLARLTDQKGLNLLMRRTRDFLAQDFGFVLLGSGDAQEEDFFRWLASAHPDRVGVQIGYTTQLAHRILAGADLFLMPSRYEPCGLTQLYAMRYGTLPLVHSTGGLNDTVSHETGFRFAPHTAPVFLKCLRHALALWQTAEWHTMQRAAMEQDTSWTKPAAAYSAVYEDLLRQSH